MDLRGQFVGAFHQQAGSDIRREDGLAIIGHGRTRAGGAGISEVIHHPGDHIAADDFSPIEVNDYTIIPLVIDQEIGICCSVSHNKALPEISGDKLVAGVWAETERCEREFDAVDVAIAERSRAARPRAVVEIRRNPARALVRAVVQVLPNRVRADDNGIHTDVHRLRTVKVAGIRLAARR